MKLLKRSQDNISILAYSSFLIMYGVKIVGSDRRYSLELTLPLFDGQKIPFKLYCKLRKPIFRNIYILNLLALPVLIVYCISYILIATSLTITNFPNQILIKQSFLTQTWEYISGWVWIAFAIYGMIELLTKFI